MNLWHSDKDNLSILLQNFIQEVETTNKKVLEWSMPYSTKVSEWSMPYSTKNNFIKEVTNELKNFIKIRMNSETDVRKYLPVHILLLKGNIDKIDDIKDKKFKDTLTKHYNKFYSRIEIQQSGGKKSKKQPKKEILGKMRCIYKIPGDRKEYLKHKGKLITVKEYKELMKAKPKKKEVKPKKVKKAKSKK